MRHKQVLSILVLAGAWIPFNAGPMWGQTTPDPTTGQTQRKEDQARTGEEKMEARGTQESGQMERKKGEDEMEARGAQKAGRMGRTEAEAPQDKGGPGEKWSKQDIQKAQEALKSKGHDPGSIDGMLGPQTRQAISAFQNANGLKKTATLDAETAKKLGIARETTDGTRSERESTATDSKGTTSPTQKESSSPAGK